MRTIKFRAWNTQMKEMHYHNFAEEFIGDWFKRISHFPHKLMQFTGLKDKNGKEIYEDDILKVVWKRDNGSRKTENMTVKFRQYLWNCGFWPFRHFNGGQPKEVEVIGNIWENKELLEEK